MIKTKTKIMDEINNAPQLLSLFNSWDEDQRESFLDICTGNKGVKMLYDSYFKEILNPEYTPDRLSYLLSVLLKRKATVKQVLSNDSTRLGDEISLVITDIG